MIFKYGIGVFFPSYGILNQTYECLHNIAPEKNIYIEKENQTNKEKLEFMDWIKEKGLKSNCILMGLQGGQFSDSLEFKRDFLCGIVIVGVPFSKPDVKQKATTEFLKSRFGGMKGHYYSQIYPAATKVMKVLSRGAGGEESKGACILMDYRFKDPKLLKALTSECEFDIEMDLGSRLEEFFKDESGGPQHQGGEDHRS